MTTSAPTMKLRMVAFFDLAHYQRQRGRFCCVAGCLRDRGSTARDGAREAAHMLPVTAAAAASMRPAADNPPTMEVSQRTSRSSSHHRARMTHLLRDFPGFCAPQGLMAWYRSLDSVNSGLACLIFGCLHARFEPEILEMLRNSRINLGAQPKSAAHLPANHTERDTRTEATRLSGVTSIATPSLGGRLLNLSVS